MRKNRFFTFILSFMPGLGHMYLGLMKKGISIMTLFLGMIFTAGFFNIPIICFILPVIWFYSFFDAINYNNLPIEQKSLIEDKLFLIEDGYLQKYRSLIGGMFVFLGIYIIYDRFIVQYLWSFGIFRIIPTIALAIIIILLGIALIKNNHSETSEDVEDLRKKKYMESDEKFNQQ